MLGESAGDEFGYYPREREADRRYIMRDIIWYSLVNGNPGCFFWNARGYEVEQFRLAGKIVAGLDLKAWRSKQVDTAVVVAHPLDNDKYYRSPQGLADYAMMGRYAQHYRSAGQSFDFAMQADGYAQTSELKAFAPAAGKGPLGVSAGWQAAAMQSEGGEGLAYVRNFAGIRRWQVPGKADLYLRDRASAALTLTWRLPGQKLTVTATDLDTGQEKQLETPGDGTVDLGASDHDWALVWRARP